MKTQIRTNRPVKAIINPGRTFTAPALPEWTIAVAECIVAKFGHGPPSRPSTTGPAASAGTTKPDQVHRSRCCAPDGTRWASPAPAK